MLFPLEAGASGRVEGVSSVITEWVQAVHKRPAYLRALEKGGPYTFSKI